MEGINAAAAKDCALLTGPCGKRPAEDPIVTLSIGHNVSVIFQKNLNHFDAAKPGAFVVSISKSAPILKFVPLLTVKDTNSTSLTLYTESVKIPENYEGDNAVLQDKYVTDNPAAPAVFYQCADVGISKT